LAGLVGRPGFHGFCWEEVRRRKRKRKRKRKTKRKRKRRS